MPERQQTDASESWWRRGMAVLRGNRRHERAAHALYGAIVAAAREPAFYDRLGVPDTMDGRFGMIGLHAALVMRRLRTAGPEGQPLAQALFDLMFADLDRNLREAGVGDLSVGRHVKGLLPPSSPAPNRWISHSIVPILARSRRSWSRIYKRRRRECPPVTGEASPIGCSPPMRCWPGNPRRRSSPGACG